MADTEPILVQKVRVLGPEEVDTLARNIPNDELRTIFEVCLWSGMRYVEVQRLHAHPNWWQEVRRSIHLPEEAQRKKKRTQRDRHIHPLPRLMDNELRRFFKGRKPPSIQVWDENLQRWATKAGMNPVGISAKATRKTIESWMITAGVPLNIVCLRQGHDSMTSMQHYQGLPFTDAEKIEIKKRLAGWIE